MNGATGSDQVTRLRFGVGLIVRAWHGVTEPLE